MEVCMKKFSFGLLAAAALVAPAIGDDTAPGAKPEVCPVVDASVVCADAKACPHADGHHEVMMTMVAVPEGGPATDATVDPTLMYMTGVPVDDAAGPTRHQEGENFRDLSAMNTMSLGGSAASRARFEGLTHSALEKGGVGPDRSFLGDRSNLKSMLFGRGNAASAKTTLVAGERVRMQKMAEVDRLRDQALASGDAKMMAKADTMEKEVKGQAKARSGFSLFGRK
jgi:hypothetical protein